MRLVMFKAKQTNRVILNFLKPNYFVSSLSEPSRKETCSVDICHKQRHQNSSRIGWANWAWPFKMCQLVKWFFFFRKSPIHRLHHKLKKKKTTHTLLLNISSRWRSFRSLFSKQGFINFFGRISPSESVTTPCADCCDIIMLLCGDVLRCDRGFNPSVTSQSKIEIIELLSIWIKCTIELTD